MLQFRLKIHGDSEPAHQRILSLESASVAGDEDVCIVSQVSGKIDLISFV